MNLSTLSYLVLFISCSTWGASPVPAPSLSPASKVISGGRVTGKLKVPGLVLRPAEKKEEPKTPAYFEFEYNNGKMFLSFKSRDPALALSPSGPLVIQLLPQTNFKVSPSLITQKNWPKSTTKIEIKISGAGSKKAHQLGAGFFYMYCNQKTHDCKKVDTSQKFEFQS